MKLFFSENFKQLRKNKDLTQEQIADVFHVSPKVVSRWETGANYPDVELLPQIAIYFSVSLDELLGVEKIRDTEIVSNYVKDIRNLLNSGRLYDAIEMSRKAVSEYPVAADCNLHYLLLQALCKACDKETPGYEENTQKFKNEIISVGERIINANPNNWGVKHMLLSQYAAWGMNDEAKRILDTMPQEIWDSQEPWAGLLLEGKEWEENQLHRIIRAKYLLEYYIRGYIQKAELSVLRKIEVQKAKIEIELLIDKISGQEVEPIELVFEYIGLAETYCEAGDTANALDYVEKAAKNALHHTEQMDKTNETDGGNYYAWSTARNLPWILWEDYLSKKQFDVVRSEKRFAECFKILKSKSHEIKRFKSKLNQETEPVMAYTMQYQTAGGEHQNAKSAES